MVGPSFIPGNFQLKQHELLSGEPVFLLPKNGEGQVCHLEEAELIEAYTYNHVAVEFGMHPCSPEEWDTHALCLSANRMGKAIIALGSTAELMKSKGVGYFTRNPAFDLRWETTVDARV